MLLVPSADPSLHTIFHFEGVYCLFHFTQFRFDITVVQDGVGSVSLGFIQIFYLSTD